MDPGALVLDAVVLIGFDKGGWFGNIAFWHPEYEIHVPDAVWEREFTNRDDPPSWMHLTPAEAEIQTEQPGQLSDSDWRTVIVARECEGLLVTSDRNLKTVAEGYGIETRWTGRFLLDTLHACGIDEDEYKAGIDAFLADAYLNTTVEQELRTASKP